jgi:hypothetical protein
MPAMSEHEDQRARRYFGKYAGIVADNVATSGAHRGELVVRVPGILEETPDGSGSRPLEVTAAPSFLPGFFFIPEVGDPVWVEFVAGDIDFPIWTGVWYPKGAAPAGVSGPADEHRKVIRTASGHVIEIDDTPNDEKIVIRPAKGTGTIRIDNGGITLADGPALAVARDTDTVDVGTLIYVGQGSLSLQAPGAPQPPPAATVIKLTGKIAASSSNVKAG